jgi:lipopolysaccharide export system permease protein
LPALVVVISPLAVFVAAIYTLNKFNGDSELIVMSASGVSPGRLMRPFIVLGVLASVLVGIMTLHVMPASFRELRDMITQIRADFLSNVVKEGQFTSIDAGLTFHYRERSGEALLGIFFQDRRDPERTTYYIAERGQTVDVEGRSFLVLEQGSIQRQDTRSRDNSIVTFERYGVDLSSFGQDGLNVILKPRERSTAELLFPDENEEYYRWQRGRFRAELHDRFLAPIYVLAFVLIAFAALGEPRTTRQGRGVAVASAVIAVLAVRIAGFALSSAIVRSPSLVPVAYAVPILAGGAALLLIFARQQVAPWLARASSLGDAMLQGARRRMARPA